MAENVYDENSLPEDFEDSIKSSFTPLPDGMYQVEPLSVVIKDNPFYKELTEDDIAEGKQQTGYKYQVSCEYAILDEGEYYGRRLWDNLPPALRNGKKGPNKLWKFVSACLKAALTQEIANTFSESGKYYANLRSLVGKQVSIAIETTISQTTGKAKNKIVTYYAIKKELPKFDTEKSKKMGEEMKAKKK